jgi:hypothetical protein
MKSLLSIAVFNVTILASAGTAWAVKTATWRHQSSEEFAKGETDQVAISSEDHLTLAPKITEVLPSKEDVVFVNAMAATDDGIVYAATGTKGVIYKIADGKAQKFTTLDGQHIFSLLFTQEGHLLAGTGGTAARIFKIGADGTSTTLAELEGARYVWGLARGAKGAVYAATGTPGKLFFISPEGQVKALLETKEKNLLCLAVDAGGLVYAGSDTEGLIYRYNPANDSKFVLYDAKEKEISALVIDGEGNLYASTATQSAAKPGRSAATSNGGKADLPSSTGDPSPTASAPATTPKRRTVGNAVSSSSSSEKSGEGNAVYRINTSGFVTEVFRRPVVILTMSYYEKALYLGTGDEGRLYKVFPEQEETVDLGKLEAKQVMSGVHLPDGRWFVGTANSGSVHEVSTQHADKGTLTSEVLDADQISLWGRFSWVADTPEGTKVTVATRSSNVEDPESSLWDDWSAEIEAPTGAQITSPTARYFQYRITLTTEKPDQTPKLHEVLVHRRGANQAPVVQAVNVISVRKLGAKAAAILQGKDKQIKTTRDDFWVVQWSAEDPNGDQLTYAAYFREVGEQRWIQFADELEKDPIVWDTSTVSDGSYEIRVVSSDSADNPAGMALEGSRISDRIVADNTPPAIKVTSAKPEGKGRFVIEAELTDNLSSIVDSRYTVDSAKDWVYIPARDDIYDSSKESFRIEISDLDTGIHRLAIRVEDEHGNIGYHTVSIKIEP